MNKEEARILHGLYYHREIVGEEMTYTANEIKWLAKNSICNGKNWASDGKLKSVEDKDEDYLASIGATSAASARPLAYLKEAGFISFSYLRYRSGRRPSSAASYSFGPTERLVQKTQGRNTVVLRNGCRLNRYDNTDKQIYKVI